MKKIVFVLCLIFSICLVTGCKDKTIQMENGVTMTLNQELKNAITVKSNFPSKVFKYDGIYNVYETSSDLGYIFTKNDNLKLSNDFYNHLKEYKNSYCVVSEIEQEYDKPNAVFGEQRVPLDSETKSMEYTIVAWDSDGTRYSYMFRTFISGGVRYFAYSYNTGITMSIEVPLLVQKVDDKQQIFMIALPFDTTYKLGANTKIDKMLERDEYLSEEYHQFEYPAYLAGVSNKQEKVQEWYSNYCNGHFENNQFVFEYLGIKYKVDFSEHSFSIYVA